KSSNLMFLFILEDKIRKRKKMYKKNSYTSYLYQLGTKRIAQKVGEEAIETILATINKDKNELINEASDLIYHLIVLLHDQNLSLETIINNLYNRQNISIK
ncbi:phosphoribosyl-ATP diphosphatase, partial [Buchnera aphidicola]|nr:phosphoribosyl-ATP diphosphatase [Buchnera aphidicola]